MSLDWRRAIVFTHRWLGIGGGMFFAAWFASGIVMMYARMPRLSPAERRAHLEPIDLSSARVSPFDAIQRHRLDGIQTISVAMRLGRPVYRLDAAGMPVTIAAETGERLDGPGRADALEQARRFAPECAATLRYDARIETPDQWTLEIRGALPAHRIALGDADGSVVYVSERSGDLVLRTTARERRLAYAGAVVHWLYFTPFRRHSALWSQTIIWMAVAGSILCALGLAWGMYTGLASPYRGWMRWHHYAGLLFGLVTFAWIFSGLLSMDPWDWHPSTAPTRAQREAFSGGTLRLEDVTLDRLRERSRPSAPAGRAAREIQIVPFRGRARVIVDGRADDALDRDALLAAATDAMRPAPVVDVTWLETYDAYYYDRQGELPVPMLRVRFGDPQATWLYIDPVRGTIARKEERLTRVNRWLYHGLHSLDFPFLYYRRPLWDLVVIVLSLGGLTSVVTAAVPAWRRVRRRVAQPSRAANRSQG